MQFLHMILIKCICNRLHIVTTYIAYICITCIYICVCVCVYVRTRMRTRMCIYHVRVYMCTIYKFYQYINFCKLLH